MEVKSVDMSGEPGENPDWTRYVFVYHPPNGWDLAQEERDRIVATGNVLTIVRSSLYSLQWTELHLDRIVRRPLTCVLLNMADRYDYRLGGYKTRWESAEPFEVIEAREIGDVEEICAHYRYEEWPDVIRREADPGSFDPEARKERKEHVTAFEWKHAYTGHVKITGHRPRNPED